MRNMAEVRNTLKNGGEIRNLTDGKVGEKDVPAVQKSNTGKSAGPGPVGQPADSQRAGGEVRAGQKVLSDAVTGKEASQLEAAQRLSGLAGASATAKLLGLDLRPTMLGALVAPPGNSDFLRHLSPTMRRTIMRSMLAKQRKRMRRLARFLRDEKDQREQGGQEEDEQGFLEAINGPSELKAAGLVRAIEELGKTAKMLDVLDELLALQDYTISQMGTFSKG